MRSQLKDEKLREQVWPDYTFGCKRVLFSSYFLPALERANVELLTEHIAAITPSGVRIADGAEHQLDCIIWATGFQTTGFMMPMEIIGRDGLALSNSWSRGAHAHLGVCVPGFPNMFVLYGPNTNTSGGSIVFYLETQAAYLRQALAHMAARGAGSVEVRAEVEHAYDREVQRNFEGTAWMDCDSWYRDEQGRIVANWPGYMREYGKRLRSLDPSEFEFAKTPRATALTGASR
jgi:cation diffusion facilitator CzcD-associated flavoprotein CzcO